MTADTTSGTGTPGSSRDRSPCGGPVSGLCNLTWADAMRGADSSARLRTLAGYGLLVTRLLSERGCRARRRLTVEVNVDESSHRFDVD